MGLARYTLRCPGCNRVSQHVAEKAPEVQCGDCLMDRTEVVTFRVVDAKPVK